MATINWDLSFNSKINTECRGMIEAYTNILGYLAWFGPATKDRMNRVVSRNIGGNITEERLWRLIDDALKDGIIMETVNYYIPNTHSPKFSSLYSKAKDFTQEDAARTLEAYDGLLMW